MYRRYFNDDGFKNTLDDFIARFEEELYAKGILKMGENWIDDVGNVLEELYRLGIDLNNLERIESLDDLDE